MVKGDIKKRKKRRKRRRRRKRKKRRRRRKKRRRRRRRKRKKRRRRKRRKRGLTEVWSSLRVSSSNLASTSLFINCRHSCAVAVTSAPLPHNTSRPPLTFKLSLTARWLSSHGGSSLKKCCCAYRASVVERE